MRRWLLRAFAVAGLFAAPVLAGPMIVIDTSLGDITVELDMERAPGAVTRFLVYASEGRYDNTLIHRVVKDFVIQGGAMDAKREPLPSLDPLPLERNGLRNLRGTIAMAHGADPDSAVSQFFINVRDNPVLDPRRFEVETLVDTPRGPQKVPAGTVIDGFTVFGRVVAGMKAVDRIQAVAVEKEGSLQHKPVEPVLIRRVSLVTTGT